MCKLLCSLCMLSFVNHFKVRNVHLYLFLALFLPRSNIVPLVTVEFCMTCAVPPVERDGNPNRDGKLSQCILMLMDSAQLPTINLFLRCISVRCSSHRTRVISMQMNRILHLLHVCRRTKIQYSQYPQENVTEKWKNK